MARIDAAEMARTLASPFTIASTGYGTCGQRLPSTCTRSGMMPLAVRPATARCIASMEACRMLSESISSTEAEAMCQPIARSQMRSNSTSRFSAVRIFESARPRICRSGFRITAAA
ncbi:hypothetical protein D3C86_1783520 [compost metagenome]